MTYIEHKAAEYAEQIGREYEYDGRETIAEQAFLAGAAYTLSNQWRDAEKEKPEYNEIVIARIRYKDGEVYHYYSTMASIPSLIRCWIDEDNRPLDDEDEYGKVVAWMEIPEYKSQGKINDKDND